MRCRKIYELQPRYNTAGPSRRDLRSLCEGVGEPWEDHLDRATKKTETARLGSVLVIGQFPRRLGAGSSPPSPRSRVSSNTYDRMARRRYTHRTDPSVFAGECVARPVTYLESKVGDYPAVTYVFPGEGASVCRRRRQGSELSSRGCYGAVIQPDLPASQCWRP